MKEERCGIPTIVVEQPQTISVPSPTTSKTGTMLVLVVLIAVVLYYFGYINKDAS